MRYLLLLVVVSGCATLGPMPGRTGVSPIPAANPEFAGQVGFMPGYYLSASASEDPNGSAIPQLLATVDPGHVAPGLLLGGRAYGESGDTAIEPIIGYRRHVDDEQRLAVAALLYGTRMATTYQHARYSATRAGLEGAADLRLTKPNQWIEAHAIASLSITNVSADGTYCVDSPTMSYAVDCPDPFPEPPPNQVSAEVSGAYPTMTIGIAADLFKLPSNVFHGARVELMFGAGAMPRVTDGAQSRGKGYTTIGLAITLAVGGK